MIIKKLKSWILKPFQTRKKRIETALLLVDALHTALKSNGATASLTALAVINSSLAGTLTGVKKALVTVLPNILEVLEIMDVSDDSDINEENLTAIFNKYKDLGYADDKVLSATEFIEKCMKDNKYTILEVIKTLNKLK